MKHRTVAEQLEMDSHIPLMHKCEDIVANHPLAKIIQKEISTTKPYFPGAIYENEEIKIIACSPGEEFSEVEVYYEGQLVFSGSHSLLDSVENDKGETTIITEITLELDVYKPGNWEKTIEKLYDSL